jgi:sporulation protein YlmC with PRC-barrel domain
MSSTGYLKRESLIGKSVISKNAEIIGTVLDLAVSTDGRLAIQVQKKSNGTDGDSEDLFIGADQIQAVGDVILLKSGSADSPPSPVPIAAPASSAVIAPPPPPGTTAQSKTCQKCGYVNSPNAKFCIKCGANLGPL